MKFERYKPLLANITLEKKAKGAIWTLFKSNIETPQDDAISDLTFTMPMEHYLKEVTTKI